MIYLVLSKIDFSLAKLVQYHCLKRQSKAFLLFYTQKNKNNKRVFFNDKFKERNRIDSVK